ncbi:MAG: acyltransferase family protein [Schwartzia sp.]|nr:acyltransferase family protein [Schwartzia sp. (in: firmicutes)]
MKKKIAVRIELIDLVKAVTIFLVILGHTTPNGATPLYRRILYSFHMPLFFFLAGLSIRPEPITGREGWQSFLRKNTLALVVPYLIWGLIYAPFSFDRFPQLFYASWRTLTAMGTLTSLWYLPALFTARILVQALISWCGAANPDRIRAWCAYGAAPMLVIGFLCPSLELGYPWCLNVAFVAAGFILLGIALRQKSLLFAQETGTKLGAAFVFASVLFYLGSAGRGDALELSLMCDGRYGNLFWFLLNSVSGSMTVICFCMILARIAREGARPFSVSAVSCIGAHTMGIFLIHKNLVFQLILPWVRSFIPDMEFFTAFLASCAALPASLWLCLLIERYVPQILGQFPRYDA